MKTAIGLSVYNRPETTAAVFAAIAAAQPRRLFVFADGPRSPADATLCQRARAVTERVDWDCEVSYEYAERNLGARSRYSSGVNWIFEHVDDAIVLDDDCVPHPSFFRFADEMLDRYRDDERIMMVSGSNYLERWRDDSQSYHFSLFGGVWGWATWKRAWQLYDATMSTWPDEQVRSRIRTLIDDEDIWQFQARRFEALFNKRDDRYSWDLPWSLSRLVHGGLTVVPAVNLVTNLGNAEGRGLTVDHSLARLHALPIDFPLVHPAEVEPDRGYDRRHAAQIQDLFATVERHQQLAQRRSRVWHRRAGRKLTRVLRAAVVRR